MRRRTLQNIIATGRFTLPAVILITAICWVVSVFLVPEELAGTASEIGGVYSFVKLIPIQDLPLWINQAICFLLHLTIGYFLISLNNTFGIIRIRASVQTSVYLLLMAACPALHILSTGDAAAVALLLSIFFLFASYQNPNGTQELFESFILLGVGSLAFPQLTLFAPILWMGAFSFQSLTVRSFMASVLGWSLPYWFILGYSFFTEQMELFYRPFQELVSFQPPQLNILYPWEIATLSYCLILYLISSVYVFINSHKDKIRTRLYLRFLILICFCLLAFIFLQPVHCANLLPLLFVCVSILIGHMFTLTNSKVSNLFFIVAVLSLLGLLYYNIWMLS